QRARDAMGGGPRPPALTPADLNVGADALDAGVDPAALGRLAREAGADRRTVAIAVLTQLVQEGMASEQALARVTAALARDPDGAAPSFCPRPPNEPPRRGYPASAGHSAPRQGFDDPVDRYGAREDPVAGRRRDGARPRAADRAGARRPAAQPTRAPVRHLAG